MNVAEDAGNLSSPPKGFDLSSIAVSARVSFYTTVNPVNENALDP